ncbi:MAG: Ig-like domain-containing protein [Bacteroidales bacterium]
MKLKNKYAGLFLIAILFLISSCAKIVAPTGGPKDEEPPTIISSNPQNYSVNFSDDQIKIEFDEFIQLKDLNQNLIVSPPLEETPEVTVKGKTLNIEFLSELKDSTTYNIYFGSSVQDYNEGNPIENFQYVFSTGAYIDSLSIEGKVLNAFNLIPEEDVFVMLYSDFSDSVPMKKIPEYISKTDEEGFFRINNIRNEKFKLFSLRDANKNYLYDLNNEGIAFSDSVVQFKLETETIIDTVFVHDSLLTDPDEMVVDSIYIPSQQFSADSIVTDSSEFVNDSLVVITHKPIDTIITRIRPYFPVPLYYLMFFNEDKETQYLANSKRDDKRKIELMFNKPIKDSLILELLDTTIESSWYIKETNITNDTIFYWLTDSSLYNSPDLNTTISYQKEDSNLVYHWTTDTINFRYFEPKQQKGQVPDTTLNMQLNVKKNATFDLNKNITIKFNTPIDFVDTSKIKVITTIDSLDQAFEYKLFKDSVYFRKYILSTDFGEDSNFKLEIYPGAFGDIYGMVNDTSIIEFKTQKLDFYGKILANITGIDSTFQVIAQLIIAQKDTEKVYREQIVQKDQIIDFEYLPPEEFLFKVIIDRNFNGKWDTGEYLEHLQPEEVYYYDNPIKVRSNWDIEISMPLNE